MIAGVGWYGFVKMGKAGPPARGGRRIGRLAGGNKRILSTRPDEEEAGSLGREKMLP